MVRKRGQAAPIPRRRILKTLFLGPLAAALDRPAAEASAPAAAVPLLLNRFSIAGFQYYDGPALVRRLNPGAQLKLVPEPANPYNPFAVEIYLDKTKLGYVPRSDNKHLSRLIEQGAKLECRVIETDSEVVVGNRVRVEVGMVSEWAFGFCGIPAGTTVQRAARVIP